MKNRFAIVALLAAAPAFVAAQEPANKVTLEQAVQLALKNSPIVIQAQGSIKTSEANEKAAKGAFLPSLSLSAGPSYSSNRLSTPTDGVTSSAIASNYNAGVSSSVDLFTGGRNTAELNRSRANTDAAEASLIAQNYSVTLSVKSAFYDVLRAGELAQADQEALKQANEGLTTAQTRLKVGAATKSDVLRSQLTVTQAQQALSQAEAQKRSAQFALGRLVGTNGAVDAAASLSLDPKPLALTNEQLVAIVNAQAPSVVAAAADVKAADAGVKVARAQYLPAIRLSGGYAVANQDPTLSGLRGNWNVGVGISFPIFNGFQREAAVQQANAQSDVARAQFADQQRAARADLEKALATLKNAEQQIALSQQSVQVATEDLRVQRERYRLGASTILDQVTSLANLAQAQTSLVNARYDYQIARAQLETIVGRPL